MRIAFKLGLTNAAVVGLSQTSDNQFTDPHETFLSAATRENGRSTTEFISRALDQFYTELEVADPDGTLTDAAKDTTTLDYDALGRVDRAYVERIIDRSLARLGVEAKEQVKLLRGRGCGTCYDSGYRGRMAIHEIVAVDSELQRLIVSNPSRDELDTYLSAAGHRSIKADGLERAMKGDSTVEEVLRVVNQ